MGPMTAQTVHKTASLPMYNVPGMRGVNAAFWAALAPLLDGLDHELAQALSGLTALIEEPDARVA